MQIAVIGTGYVGLVVGTCFADTGNDVTCVDLDSDKIANLNAGKIPIYEPGLETMIRHNVQEGRLKFTTESGPAIKAAEVVFIAVGTPEGEDGSRRFAIRAGGGHGDRHAHGWFHHHRGQEHRSSWNRGKSGCSC